MSDNMQRSGRGGNVLGASRRYWQQRKGSRDSSIRSQRPVLPVSSSGRVSTDNPAVIDWLARSSSSSQVTSDTLQPTVGGYVRDTHTVSWHGPGPSPLKSSRVLYALPCPLLFPHQAKYRMLWAQPHCTVRKS
ncbi:unnamed protein product [Staurois parvus]|uniref:Uncharacterized protein n=1 Tax=Staurois parvus TaxID=386267 RepID=A0ABN9EM24_9NEOB|nr:unnamed protein product [Staurois parvus]